MKMHWFACARFLVGLLVLLAGMMGSGGAVVAAVPKLVSVTPNSFANMVNIGVTIQGENLGQIASAVLEANPTANPPEIFPVKPALLRNLQPISSGEVRALAPWDAVPAVYDLKITLQSGESLALEKAVTVTQGNASWASSGPYGGVLKDVVVDPRDGQQVFVSAGNSGLFHSQNGGESWGLLHLTASPDRVQMVYGAPGQPPVMYTQDNPRGAVRSTDYGQTWQEKPLHALDYLYDMQSHVFVRPGHPNSVYLAVYDPLNLTDPLGGLYESTDQGDTWQIMAGTSGVQASSVAFDPDDDLKIVLASFNGQVLTSSDGGAHWSDPIPAAPRPAIRNRGMRLDFSPTLFNGARSLWLTPCISVYDGKYDCTFNDVDNNQIEDTVYRSADGGQTWAPVRVAQNVTVRSLAFSDSIPGLMWAAAGGGFYSQDGGDTWQPAGPGLYEVIGFAAVPGALSREKTTLFAATQRGLFKSADGGSTWQESDAGLGAVLGEAIAISPFNADEAYVATVGGSKGLLHTSDGGRNWNTLPIPVGDESPVLAADPFVDGKVYFSYPHWDGGTPLIGVSQDHGQSYADRPVERGDYVATIEPDPRTPGHILVGVCERGDPSGLGYIYASADGGVTWKQQAAPPGISCINSIAFDPHWNSACGPDPDPHPEEKGLVYATSETSGVLRSTDGGATWELFGPNPPTQSFIYVVVDPLDSSSIFVRGRGGLDPSSNSGVYVRRAPGKPWLDLQFPAWGLKFVLATAGPQPWQIYARWVDGLSYNKNVYLDPTQGWEPAPGIAGDAAITGFNAATECDGEKPARVVYYIGMVGGPKSQYPQSKPAAAGRAGSQRNASAYIPGGIYRSMTAIDGQPAVPGWELKGISGAGSIITALEAFNGQLYAASADWGKGARVWRYQAPDTWVQASEPGMSPAFGAGNSAIPDLAVFKGQLYAAVGWGANAGQIWRTANGADWSQVTGAEFGGSPAFTPAAMAVFQDHLYAFASGENKPLQTWRSSTGGSGTWEHLTPDGFGNLHNASVTGAAVFNGALYAVTGNAVDGVEVWRTSDGKLWTQVNASGFGAPANQDSSGMVAFKGALYVGVTNASDGGQLWRYNGASWSKAAPDGFGDPRNQSVGGLYATPFQLYAVTKNLTSGLQVWTSTDGSRWNASNRGGFHNPQNTSTFWSNAVTGLGSQVYVGTWDGGMGGEVWAHRETFFPVYVPVLRR